MANDNLIVEVKECNYRDFYLSFVEGKGWKTTFDGQEIVFPHLQAAQEAIDLYRKTINEIIAISKRPQYYNLQPIKRYNLSEDEPDPEEHTFSPEFEERLKKAIQSICESDINL